MTDFLHHFYRIKSYNTASACTIPSTPYPSTSLNARPPTQQYYSPKPPSRFTHYQASPSPRRSTPGCRPCSFYQQFMRVRPKQSDEQCRDMRHPKFYIPDTKKLDPGVPTANQTCTPHHAYPQSPNFPKTVYKPLTPFYTTAVSIPYVSNQHISPTQRRPHVAARVNPECRRYTYSRLFHTPHP